MFGARRSGLRETGLPLAWAPRVGSTMLGLGAQRRAPRRRPGGRSAPSSRGLGHHPLKVETRVRTPLGLLIGLDPIQWTALMATRLRQDSFVTGSTINRHASGVLGKPAVSATSDAEGEPGNAILSRLNRSWLRQRHGDRNPRNRRRLTGRRVIRSHCPQRVVAVCAVDRIGTGTYDCSKFQ